MSKKISIIIPTYNHCVDLLKPLCESIIKYTNLIDIEVLVVANGCIDNTKEYVNSLGDQFKLIWSEEALGYTKATNFGIKNSLGEFVILLNNDCILLPQPINQWIDTLLGPMKYSDVGMSGPMKTFCPEAQMEFLIFFCVCIKRKIFDEIGLLDEIFSPGYGEDTDFAAKLELAGYKFANVCPTNKYYGPNQMTGDFPIYHIGNVTFKNWVGGEELLKKNNQILAERYAKGIKIDKAYHCDGYMNIHELRWLARKAKTHKMICEVGSWHGRSSRAIADNLPEDGVLYCVDTWNGSITEPQNHGSAKWENGDHAFMEFCDNNIDLIKSGKIVPIRMNSESAVKMFKKHNTKFDMIFIDAGHTYEECKKDIDTWKYLIEDSGLFCGHDYNGWAGVNQAVEEKIARFDVDTQCTIWYCEKNDIKPDKPTIYDTFIFNNELDILEIRLNEMYSIVDRFVIVEGNRTHSNKSKSLNFNDNLKRFEKFLHKITYIVVEDWPATDSWSMERHQRDCIMRGLTSCKDNDIIIMGDCDEIARASSIKEFEPSKIIMNFEQNLYYYSLNCQADQNWDWLKITTYKNLKEKTPCGIRYTPFTATDSTIKNGGWHFSYCTDISGIIYKIDCTAHQEYNRDDIKDRSRLEKLVKEGKDVFGRNLTYHFTEINETYPNYILENLDKYKHLVSEHENTL